MIHSQLFQDLRSTLPGPISSLNFDPNTQQLIAMVILPTPGKDGNFNCILYTLDPKTGVFTQIIKLEDQDTFINFQWTEFNPDSSMLYLLMGDENAAIKLRTKLYTVDIKNKALQHAVITDYSEFTIASMHYLKKIGLVSFSYGLVLGNGSWSFVGVDEVSGQIKQLLDVSPAGVFEKYYGGEIYEYDAVNGFVYYRLVRGTMSHIVQVDLKNGATFFGQPLELGHISNIAFIAP
eukprot:TRINITY_DN3761_c0_g1_i2.p1 TRINITY_DN3761_c0_g1~~TRINITY_DN3761_c0_g1_i2.p1  ORF type:complete len:235 (-),score=67.98 TRINITY_DN3761_c0_g1_i2:44-748(-)